jgi:hypothetical protein
MVTGLSTTGNVDSGNICDPKPSGPRPLDTSPAHKFRIKNQMPY